MSLWHGRAPKWIGAAALALAVLAAPGSAAFARSGHGGYHHGGGYRGGYGSRTFRALPRYGFGSGLGYGYRYPHATYRSRPLYPMNRYYAYPRYGYRVQRPFAYGPGYWGGHRGSFHR